MLFMPITTDQWKAPLAPRWQGISGFPPEIAQLLATNEAMAGAIPLVAIPGHEVPLKGGLKASPADLWVLARTRRGLVSIAVDANAADSFGPTVGEWRTKAAPGRTDRWSALCGLLEVNGACEPSIRSRLLHRTAGALIEARRFCAAGAAVIVHASSATRESFGDFQQFVAMMGGRLAGPGELVSVPPREGMGLCFGWAHA